MRACCFFRTLRTAAKQKGRNYTTNNHMVQPQPKLNTHHIYSCRHHLLYHTAEATIVGTSNWPHGTLRTLSLHVAELRVIAAVLTGDHQRDEVRPRIFLRSAWGVSWRLQTRYNLTRKLKTFTLSGGYTVVRLLICAQHNFLGKQNPCLETAWSPVEIESKLPLAVIIICVFEDRGRAPL